MLTIESLPPEARYLGMLTQYRYSLKICEPLARLWDLKRWPCTPPHALLGFPAVVELDSQAPAAYALGGA
jgi:hypothetical protein